MEKRKWKLMVLAVCSALAISGCASNESEKKETATGEYADLKSIEIILADSAAKGAAGEQFDRAFAEKLEKITGGKIKVDFHPNGDLGNDIDLIRQMKNGDIDLVGSQIAPWVSFHLFKKINENEQNNIHDRSCIILVNFNNKEVAAIKTVSSFAGIKDRIVLTSKNGNTKIKEALSGAYQKAGFELLGIEQNATYRLATSNRALNKLEDYRGIKIRTMENKNHMKFWSAIGAEPTPLAFGEVYISLQNGTIDAEENAADTILGANFQEVQKYLTCTNHILYANQLSMNKAKYDALAPAYKKAMKLAFEAALKEMRPKMANIDKEYKGKLKEKGMIVTEYDKPFFDQVLALDSIKELYKEIDQQVNGLGTTLQEELENYAKK